MRKILVVGASGYGNIGDDIYPEVFKHFLGEKFKLYFAPDTTRMGKKGQLMEMNSQNPDLEFDALIIGGGGLLRDFPTKNAVRYYMERAITQEKPFFVVSAGLQTTLPDPSLEDAKKILGSSADLLKKASLIFLRSAKDGMLLRSVLGDSISHRLQVRPDLGYLYPRIVKPIEHPKKYISLIQTGSASVKSEHVRSLIAEALKKHPHSELVVMNWGGSEEPEKKEDYREYGLFAREVHTHYPNAKIHMGNSISSKLKEFRYSMHTTRASDLTPDEAIQIVAQSHLVITGRYHGLVIAKALNIPCVTATSTFKILAEKDSPLDITQAQTQIDLVGAFIQRNGIAIKDPLNWADEDRNTFIVQVSKEFNIPVPHVQSLGNKEIWQKLVFGRSLL